MYLNSFSKYIIYCVESKGYSIYVVGGAVRNYLLGFEYSDYDFTTNALATDIIEIFNEFKLNKNGLKWGSIGIIFEGKEYKITTFRKECNYNNFCQPDDIEFCLSFKDDYARRDFTMNALGFNPKYGFIDYGTGIADLQKKLIKFIGEPKKRIIENPIRILRAIRFACEYDLNLADETLDGIIKYKDYLNYMPKQTCCGEWLKILKAPFFSSCFDKYSQLIEQCLGLKCLDQLQKAKCLTLMTHFSKEWRKMVYVLEYFYNAKLCDCFNIPPFDLKALIDMIILANGNKLALMNLVNHYKKKDIMFGLEVLLKTSDKKMHKQILQSYDYLINNHKPCVTAMDILEQKLVPKEKLNDVLKSIEWALMSKEIANDKEIILDYIKHKFPVDFSTNCG